MCSEKTIQAEADAYWMGEAIKLAKLAECEGEVPVGAVLVQDGQRIAEGRNSPIGQYDPCSHAEIIALREAGKKLKNYRLLGATLYVTLEPCMMCVGAMVHARITRLVFGAGDPKTGACGGHVDLLNGIKHNHRIAVKKGVLASECSSMLRLFFSNKRLKATSSQ